MTTAQVTISDRLEFVQRRIKTLAAVTEDCEQYSLLPVRRDRIQYAINEGEHQLRLLQAVITELFELQNPQPQTLNPGGNPCPENASTTASQEARGKDSAPASSESPPPGTTFSMFRESH